MVAAEPVVMAVGVDANSFIAASSALSQVKKTASLLKAVSVNALIVGESGVGKRKLASFILPEAPVVDALDFDALLLLLESSKELVITNIDNSPNLNRVVEAVKLKNVRVVATSEQFLKSESIDDLFSVKFTIPPLRERQEDVVPLIQRFVEEAAELFGRNELFDSKNFKPDLSKNVDSLRRQVMIHYLLEDIKDSELMEIVEKYLYDKLGSNSDYRKFLYLYEVPLIQAGLKRFKSQSQLSEKLGLNRNTLRKKISENRQYLKG